MKSIGYIVLNMKNMHGRIQGIHANETLAKANYLKLVQGYPIAYNTPLEYINETFNFYKDLENLSLIEVFTKEDDNV